MTDDDLGIDIPRKLFFRIGEVAELLGVEPHVLRYWESEFKMRPRRSQSGQRMYQRKDIARFVKIRGLLHEEGFTIAGARKALSAAAAAVPRVQDPGQVRLAVKRVSALQERLREVRRRFAGTLPFPLPADDD